MADSIRVLYVDDEPGLLGIGKVFLERYDKAFTVDTLTSASEALTQLNRECYDVIISDYQMPEMDGITFLKRLKASGNTTPFIIFTGRGREEVVIEAINEGADFYLQKGGEPKAQFAELSNKIRYAVTKRRAEEALRQREHDFTSLVENATDMIVRFDTSLRYIYCNPVFERLMGVLLPQIRGKTPLESATSPEWNRFIEASLRWTLEIGKEQEVELLVPTTSGKRFLLTRIVPEHDVSGSIISLLATTRDITDRKLVEEALRENEVKFKTLFETATDALFMMDASVFLDCNRSTLEIFGCSLDQIIGHSPLEFSPDRQPDGRLSAEKIKEKIDAALSGDPQFFEWVYLHYDRTPFDAEVTFNNIPLGNSWFLQSAVRDVSTRKHAERALLASETFNRSLVENLPDYIVVHGQDGRILYANPASSRGLGYNTDQFVGTSLLSHVAEEHRSVLLSIISADKEWTKIPLDEIDLLTRDGSWRSVIVKCTPIQYQDNPAYLTLFVDITERKRAEAALRESADQYRNVVEDQTEFICRFRPDGTHIFVNEAYCRYFNLKREEIIGHRFRPQLHPEDQEIVAQHLASLTAKDPVMNITQRIMMPDGHTQWQRWSDRAIFDENGRVIEYQSVGRDITGQKEAELALLESESRLHAAVHGSPIPKFVIDKNHAVIYWNKALEEHSGIRAAEMVGTNQQWRAFYPHQRPCLADLLVDGAIGKIPQWYEGKYGTSKFIEGAYEATDFFPKLGTTGIWLYFTAAPIRDTKGNIIGAMETLEDITLRKLAEEALRQSNRNLKLLSSITRHDINNQLGILQGYSGIVEETQLDPSQREYFKKITAAADRISAMIRFTKEYEEIGVHAPAWQDCHALIDNAAKQATLGDVTVKNDIPAGAEVFSDPLTGKVFYNLIDNALRYGGKIKSITFSVEENQQDHILICEDDGDGIPAEEAEKIFERGFGKNTGMGLFLSREILSITNISIRETGEPGKGARFEMTVTEDKWRMDRAAGPG